MSFDAELEVIGLDETKQKLELLEFAIETHLTLEELTALAERIRDIAAATSAFRTGFMRSTIYIEIDPTNLTVKVGYRSGYSKFVELGTSKMTAHPSLVPALFIAINEFKRDYPERIKRFAQINVRKQ